MTNKYLDSTYNPDFDTKMYENGGVAIGKVKRKSRRCIFTLLAVGTTFAVASAETSGYEQKLNQPVYDLTYVDSTNSVDNINVIAVDISIIKNEVLKESVRELSNLEDNWDGYDAKAPSTESITNAQTFIDLLNRHSCFLPKEEDIYATTYGSIVVDIQTTKGQVSIEIGSSLIGFFTDFSDGNNYGSEGIPTDFKSIPQELLRHIC